MPEDRFSHGAAHLMFTNQMMDPYDNKFESPSDNTVAHIFYKGDLHDFLFASLYTKSRLIYSKRGANSFLLE